MYSHYLNHSHVSEISTISHHHHGHSHAHRSPTAPQPDSGNRSVRNNLNQQNQDTADNQVDSGHPSLENSVSPTETRPSSGQESPKLGVRNTQAHSASLPSAPPPPLLETDNGILKHNPFVVNGVQRIPNKVILEPIANTIREVERVPRHLFAAKRNVS